MIPEIFYLSGLIPNIILSLVHLGLHQKLHRSKAFFLVQKNLAKLGRYWQDMNGEIIPLTEHAKSDEQKKYTRYFLAFSFLTFIMSWPGFAFHLLIMVSMRKLAVPRLEKNLFSSKLAQDELSTDEVASILRDIESLSI